MSRVVLGDCLSILPTLPDRCVDLVLTDHPTQKPVDCLTPLIETFSKPRDIVLDPFAGSGSTCVAARQVGRGFYGIEMDPTYHAAATQRLQLARQERIAA